MSESLQVWHLVLAYRYWIILPLACFEGPLVAFIAGALCARGFFEIEFVFCLLLLGDIIPDFGCFLLGRYAAHSAFFGRLVGRRHIGHPLRVTTALWHRHGFKTMVFGKLSYGLSMPFLVSAGLAGLPLWKFAGYACPVSVLQYALFLASGYYLGWRMNAIASFWQYAPIILAAVLVLAVLLMVVGAWLNRQLSLMSDCEG